MRGKRYIRRVIISFILLFTILVNNMQPFFHGELSENVQAAAAEALNVKKLWETKKSTLSWTDTDDKPTELMWHDTSKTDAKWIDESDEGITIKDKTADDSIGQQIIYTGDIENYTISKSNADGYITVKDYAFSGVSYDFTDKSYEDIPMDNLNDLAAWQGWGDDNQYDNNNNTSVTAWKLKKESGADVRYVDIKYTFNLNKTDAPSLYYSVEYDAALDGYYRRYYVSTADQLAVLLDAYETSARVIQADSSEIPDNADESSKKIVDKLGIELLCDIDLGGAEGRMWYGYTNRLVLLEIDGNGHGLYNGYFKSSLVTQVKYNTDTLRASVVKTDYWTFLRSDQKFYIHDAVFSNQFIAHEGGMFGHSVRHAYFNNVNWERCMSMGGGGTAIVLGYNNLCCYLKECTIDNSYVYGSSHCALFASYNSFSNMSEYTYTGDSTPPDNAEYYYTDIPDSAAEIERSWLGKKSGEQSGITLSNMFPSIYESCASVNSEVYDVGGEHSGTFVSCLQSMIIFKNCFSNCTIYARTKLGVFIGAVIGSGDGFYYPYNGKKTFVNSYFENCYTSGAIEGETKLGGFVGIIFDDARAYDPNYSSPATEHRGKTVFKNCYSTSSVGMQYSGQQVGGFAGLVRGNIQADTDNDTTARRHIFENCYAAGEVGGITTDTSTAESNTNSIGGFMGAYINYSSDAVGVSPSDALQTPVSEENNTVSLIKCYYDKQTTAMRERDIGNYSYGSESVQLNNTLEGLEGVYTKYSKVKRIKGLTDINPDDGTVWQNMNGYYPQLISLTAKPNALAGDDAKNLVKQMKYNRKLSFYYYSLASTAAVFLDHYDEILNESGQLEAANMQSHVYDTVRDITRKFELTTDDSNGIEWDADNSEGSRNAANGFVEYLGEKAAAAEGEAEHGFSVNYESAVLSNNEENKTLDYTAAFKPKVLTISKSDDGMGKIVYKCFDFAPGKQWVTVTAADADNKAVYGQRALRLLPTAYLNAGEMIHINISKDEDNTGQVPDNVVTMDSESSQITLNGFNHSVGVVYAITDRYRMGTDIYNNQKLLPYTQRADNDRENFAYYKKYPAVTDADLSADETAGIKAQIGKKNEDGSIGLLEQRIEVANKDAKYSNIRNLSYNSGGTMVKIYKAVPEKDENGSWLLNKEEEIDYSGENIKKWQGEAPFVKNDTVDDTGFYYLDYYWRLDDGRYLMDSKLVRISADSYNVEMITGILNEKHTIDKDKTPQTCIDQYVTDNITGDDSTYSWTQNYPSMTILPDEKHTTTVNDNLSEDDYNSYNQPREYNGDVYYTKTLKMTTAQAKTAVGWYRGNEYRLTTLIIEAIDEAGTAHEMTRIDTNNQINEFDFSNAEYQYDFTGYKITQNPETKVFTVEENAQSEKKFKIQSASGTVNNSVTKYILFNLEDSNQAEAYTTINDSLRVTALFRRNTSDVWAEKNVLLNAKSEVLPVADGSSDDRQYYTALDEADKAYEVDNGRLSENENTDENRKAVLSGDTLTYRVKLHNTGYMESDIVNVYDTVPDNCTYVKDSMKIYRQEMYNLSSGMVHYGNLTEMTQTEDSSPVKMQEKDGSLKWSITSMPLNYVYYAEYKVTVDDLPASELKRVLTNEAQWDFVSLNGDVIDSADVGDSEFSPTDLKYFKKNAIFSMDVLVDDETADESGIKQERTYTIDFKKHDEADYKDISFTDDFPSNGFTFNEKKGIEVYKKEKSQQDYKLIAKWAGGSVDNSLQQGINIIVRDAGFTILGMNILSGEEFRVVFYGTQEKLGNDTGVTEIHNKASVSYRKKTQGEEADQQSNAIAKTERITNKVSTDVTHLYLNIEKQIAAYDPAQSFLMKLCYYKGGKAAKNGTAGETFYTRINCTNEQQDSAPYTYTGNSIVQCDRRGVYVVEEDCSWSNTDYEFDGSEEEKKVSITLPETMYESGAFPASLGTDLSALPKVVFKNKESIFAYLSGQSYAENVFNFVTAESNAVGDGGGG